MASARTSAARRDRAKAIVLVSVPTSRVVSSAASRSALVRAPVSSSISGGFHRQNTFSPRGDRSSATSAKGRPVRRSASSAGLPTVADAITNLGSPP